MQKCECCGLELDVIDIELPHMGISGKYVRVGDFEPQEMLIEEEVTEKEVIASTLMCNMPGGAFFEDCSPKELAEKIIRDLEEFWEQKDKLE